MRILGINSYLHDSSAALIEDGVLKCAVEEERFTREKHAGGIPFKSIEWCLSQADGRPDVVVFGKNPLANLDKKIVALFKYPQLFKSALVNIHNKKTFIAQQARLPSVLKLIPVKYVEHHLAHAAYAYATGQEREAAFLSIDGFGDFVSTCWGRANSGRLSIGGKTYFPHSLGNFYTAITQFLGFPYYGEEYKVMALASFGAPRYTNEMRKLIGLKDGNIQLNLNYFSHTTKNTARQKLSEKYQEEILYSEKIKSLFGEPREREERLTQDHFDIAASMQALTNEIIIELAKFVKEKTGLTKLVLSGGVALNSAANGVLVQNRVFDDVWIPSAPSDSGIAAGAAFFIAMQNNEGIPPVPINSSPFLGPESIEHMINEMPGYEKKELNDSDLIEVTTKILDEGGVLGWFEGKMEFGPRALGHRSILADPRKIENKIRINSMVKKRESFRPFAPMVLEEDANIYFEIETKSPNMMIVAKVRKEWIDKLPAITHVDGTARVQTVNRATLPRIHALLAKWKKISGVSVLLNTSFNENEPIVCTPEQAKDCAARTNMEALVINDSIFIKK